MDSTVVNVNSCILNGRSAPDLVIFAVIGSQSALHLYVAIPEGQSLIAEAASSL